MLKTKLLFLSTFVFLIVAASAGMAHGATATVATLVITDGKTGEQKVVFNVNDMVNLTWTADGTVDINVTFHGSTYMGWTDQPTTGQVSFNPDQAGYYTVSCTGASDQVIAVGTFLVVPFSPLGPLAAFVACFGTLGAFKQGKPRRLRS
jgi:hypothetical protein